MSQGVLFAADFLEGLPDGNGLRYYQQEAADSCRSIWETGERSALVVMATGLGKTRLFSQMAAEHDGSVLVIAHRDELIQQAQAELERATGEFVDLEQATFTSDRKSRLVVGSVQSLYQKKRLERLGRDRFSLVIADEAHHYVAPSYRRVLDWFTSAKVMGVTATPDRGDEKALGLIFDQVAFCFDIEDGIDAGYLVPIRGRQVTIDEIELDNVAESASDLNQSQLDEEMLKAVEGIVRKTLELEPERKAIAFLPGVRSAEYCANRFNAVKPGSACFVCGETEPEERRTLIADFKRGRYQYLVNCQIACLDSATEILTREGWVGHEQITPEHRIANWTPDGIFFEKPLAIEVRQRRPDEEMFSLLTPRASMRITGDHRVVFRKANAHDWSVLRANKLANSPGEFPVCGDSKPEKHGPSDSPPLPLHRRIAANSYVLRKNGLSIDAAREEALRRIHQDCLRYKQPAELTIDDCLFIGFWLGDGGINKLASGGVECVLHNDKKLVRMNAWIDKLLSGLGMDIKKRSRARTLQWSLPRGTGFGPQKRRGFYPLEPYLDKSGADLLWSLTASQFYAVLQGFWMADGDHGDAHEPRDVAMGRFNIHNTNRRLMDKLQAIAVCRGLRCSVKWREQKPCLLRGKVVYPAPIARMSINRRDCHIMTKFTLQKEAVWHPEIVWCVKSSSSFIVARRNGNVFVTGNTEGFDCPDVSLIIQGRPTKSRALYAQMIGRGTRVLPNTIGHLEGKQLANARRRAVAQSAKPDLQVLDFVGNSTRHALVSVVDILGGNFDEKEVYLAKKKAQENPGGDIQAMLRAARAELMRMARETAARRLVATVREFNPFATLGIEEPAEFKRFGVQPLTEKQREFLKKKGVKSEELDAMSKHAAGKLITAMIQRQDAGVATLAQLQQLKRYGVDNPSLSFKLAGRAMEYIAQTVWQKQGQFDPAQLQRIVSGQREPGEEG